MTHPEIPLPDHFPTPHDMIMELSDGTGLAARVWRPDAQGSWPVLLMRLPYGRSIASTVTLAHPSWYARQGYVVAVQEVRGTGNSDGRFDPFVNEARDGAEACEWARNLAGGNGKVGLYGFSYQGMTQHLSLAGGGAADAIAPVMAAWDTWEDFTSEGGALRLDWTVAWAMQLGAQEARRQGDAGAYAEFMTAANALPVSQDKPALPEIASSNRHLTHLADWVEAMENPAYWAQRSPSKVAIDEPDALRVPAFYVGGWYDEFLRGTIAAFDTFDAAGANTRLVIGPWTHLDWTGGDLSVDAMTVAWFDHALKGQPLDGPKLQLWDVTRAEWRGFDAWPEDRHRLWLGGNGLAAANSSGRLSECEPEAPGIETFVHDPWRPVPAFGHYLTPPYGGADRKAIDARADVAVFTSLISDVPLRLVGTPVLEVSVHSDAQSFDLHAALSIVTPDGAARTISLGHMRSPTGQATLRMDLRPVTATVEPGACLRLSLSGAAFPAFAVNPGTGDVPELTPRHSCAPITLNLLTPASLTFGVAP